MAFIRVVSKTRESLPAAVARVTQPVAAAPVVAPAVQLAAQQDASNGTELGGVNVIYGDGEIIVGGGKPILI